MSTKEAVITLRDGNAYVDIKDPATGAIQSKGLSTDALGDAFNAHTSMRTPLLPGQWGTRFYAKKGNFEYFVMTIAPKKRTVKWDTSDEDEDEYQEYNIETPPLCWFVKIQQNGDSYHLIDSYMFALKNDLITMNDELYLAPFTNVYSSNGICWNGSISMNLPSPAAVLSLDASFFNARFNSDLDDNKFRATGDFSRCRGVRATFNVMDEGASFDLDILRKAQENVGTFINRLMA